MENMSKALSARFLDKSWLPGWLRPWHELTGMSYHTVSRRLARIARYGGATPRWYSVARHSRLVSLLLPSEATPQQHLWALLHDAHEIFIGDILRPLERSLSDAARRELADRRREIDDVLCDLMGLDITDEDRAVVQVADDHACFLEIRLLDECDSAIHDALSDNPEAAYEICVLGRSDMDSADWREAWTQWNGAAEAVR